MMIISLSTLVIITVIATLIYWVKSLIIMSKNTLFLILGIFFSPFTQLGYFFSRRNKMDNNQATAMKRFFMVIGIYLVIFVFYMVVLTNQITQI
ncbi:MAG: hypothetical protein Q4B88_04900 [Moraxella sp.]|nr:hypothetical protein [Moraxella sp.]